MANVLITPPDGLALSANLKKDLQQFQESFDVGLPRFDELSRRVTTELPGARFEDVFNDSTATAMDAILYDQLAGRAKRNVKAALGTLKRKWSVRPSMLVFHFGANIFNTPTLIVSLSKAAKAHSSASFTMDLLPELRRQREMRKAGQGPSTTADQSANWTNADCTNALNSLGLTATAPQPTTQKRDGSIDCADGVKESQDEARVVEQCGDGQPDAAQEVLRHQEKGHSDGQQEGGPRDGQQYRLQDNQQAVVQHSRGEQLKDRDQCEQLNGETELGQLEEGKQLEDENQCEQLEYLEPGGEKVRGEEQDSPRGIGAEDGYRFTTPANDVDSDIDAPSLSPSIEQGLQRSTSINRDSLLDEDVAKQSSNTSVKRKRSTLQPESAGFWRDRSTSMLEAVPLKIFTPCPDKRRKHDGHSLPELASDPPHTIPSTATSGGTSRTWDALLEQLSEDSAKSFAVPESWVSGDAIDFLLAVLVPPPYHVVNSSAVHTFEHKQYRVPECDNTAGLPHMVVPMCDGTHWVVAILDTDTAEATVLDSLSSSIDLWREMLERFYSKLPIRSEARLSVNHATNACQQENDFSCGIYAILHALIRTNGLSSSRIDDALARDLLHTVILARNEPVPTYELPASARCPVPSQPTKSSQQAAAPSGDGAGLLREIKAAKSHYQHLKALWKAFKAKLKRFKDRKDVMEQTCALIELLYRRLDEELEEQERSRGNVFKVVSGIQGLSDDERTMLNHLCPEPFRGLSQKKLEAWNAEHSRLIETRRVLRVSIERVSQTQVELAEEMRKASVALSAT